MKLLFAVLKCTVDDKHSMPLQTSGMDLTLIVLGSMAIAQLPALL